jgi:group I intron endonuclease
MNVWYVYKTVNTVNGKIYIGLHHVRARKRDEKYLGSGILLQYAIKKYGKDRFIQEVIEFCDSKEKACERERFWIKELRSQDKSIGYNISDGGQGGWCSEVNSRISKKVWANYSEEERQERFKKMRDGIMQPEVLEVISRKGKEWHQSMTEDQRKEYSKKCSDGWTSEKKETQSENHKGSKNSMFGKSLFERWIEKYGEEEAIKRREQYSVNMKEALRRRHDRNNGKSV